MVDSLLASLGLYGATFAVAFIAGIFPIVSVELFLVGATALGANRVDVFVRGNDSALYHRVWYAGLGWVGWDLGVGQLTSAPEGVWRASNWLDVFVRGNDGQLWQLTWTGSGWSGFRPLL